MTKNLASAKGSDTNKVKIGPHGNSGQATRRGVGVMKYTVFIDNGYDGLECLGVFTKGQIEEMLIINKLIHQGIRKEDLTVVAGEIVEQW